MIQMYKKYTSGSKAKILSLLCNQDLTFLQVTVYLAAVSEAARSNIAKFGTYVWLQRHDLKQGLISISYSNILIHQSSNG